MTEFEFSPHFERYIDPTFWSGHMLGDGDAKSLNRLDLSGQPDGQSTRHAREVLEERLPQMEELSPMQRFERNMLFDTEEHPTGTIVAYKRHSLINLSARASRNLQNPEDDYRPGPYLELNLGYEEGSPKIVVENELMYMAKVLWGVVSKNRKGEPTLVSFSHSFVYRTSGMSVEVSIRDYNLQKPHFRIGDADHRVIGKNKEKLDKVSELYVVGYGKSKKARKYGKQLFNSIIPKPVINSAVIGLSNES